MKFLIILIVLAIAAWFLLRPRREKNIKPEQAKSGSASDDPGTDSAMNLVDDPQSSSSETPPDIRNSGTHVKEREEATNSQNTPVRRSRDIKSADNSHTATGVAAGVAAAAAVSVSKSASASPDAAKERSSTGSASDSDQPANAGSTQVSGNSPAIGKTAAGTSALESSQQEREATSIQSGTASTGIGSTGIGAVVASRELQSGNTLYDVREMIKILNLRDNDAARLNISKEDFARVWSGDAGTIASDVLDSIAAKLRHMLG